MNTKVTIKDIARIAGVSVSTVSRAINDDNEVSKKTKEKIDAIIREQNYRQVCWLEEWSQNEQI